MTRAFALFLLLSVPALAAPGAKPSEAERLWSAHIQPMFAESCFKCHGNIETKSGLNLMSQADALRGGDGGPSVIPGQPAKSPLYQYVQPDAETHMPPKGKPLTFEEIALLKRWIEKLSPTEARAATNPPAVATNAIAGSPLFRKAAAAQPKGLTSAQTIDHWIEQRWDSLKVKASRICDDRTFVRRVYLDLAGRIPLPSESEAFLSDQRRSKRSLLIQQLLDSDDYAVRMREVFDVVFMERGVFQSPRERRRNAAKVDSVERWQRYLEWSFRENRPWNVIAHEILLARPETNFVRGAEHFLYARKDNAQQMAEATGSALMGLQIRCAQCHDHPLAPEIKQSHYWGMVAAFNRTKAVETSAGSGVAESAVGGFIKFTNLKGTSTEAVMAFLDGQTVMEKRPKENEKENEAAQLYANATPLGEGKDLKRVPVPRFSRREQLADWLMNTNNPLLPRAFVNRTWAMLVGRGLVHPVDRIDSSRPASHPELLDWLTDDFVKNGYDIKRLIQTITTSRAYQLDTRPAGATRPADDTFARGLEKPLSAEVLARSMLIATGSQPEADGSSTLSSLQKGFADAFPDLFPTEQVSSLRQALFLSNNRSIAALLDSSSTNALSRATALDDPAKVRLLFARVFGREPDRPELNRAVDYLRQRSEQPEAATRQLLWALVTSAEFRNNH